jgi:hypothetical protein
MAALAEAARSFPAGGRPTNSYRPTNWPTNSLGGRACREMPRRDAGQFTKSIPSGRAPRSRGAKQESASSAGISIYPGADEPNKSLHRARALEFDGFRGFHLTLPYTFG